MAETREEKCITLSCDELEAPPLPPYGGKERRMVTP